MTVLSRRDKGAMPRGSTVTVLKDGRVTLPASIRKQRGWEAGTDLVVLETPEGILLKRKERLFPSTRHEDVAGLLKYEGPQKSLADMDEAITEMVKERHARGRY